MPPPLFFSSFARGGGDDGEHGWQALHGERKHLRGLGYGLIVSLLMTGDAFRGVKDMSGVRNLAFCAPLSFHSAEFHSLFLLPFPWLALFDAFTNTHSLSHFSLSYSPSSHACRALTRLWVFPVTPACLAHLLCPSAVLHFLRLRLILYNMHAHLSSSFPLSQSPSLLLALSFSSNRKEFPTHFETL